MSATLADYFKTSTCIKNFLTKAEKTPEVFFLDKPNKKTDTFDAETIYKELKVLIIDDHDPIRKAMRRILVKMGIQEITECSDGESALKEIEKTPDIDLLLCDIYMRQKSGFDILKHVRSKNIRSDIPFIVVTGEASKEDIVKASALGADDYIIKPFQADSLIAKVSHVIKQFFDPPPLMSKLRQADRAYLAHQYDHATMAYQQAIKLDADSKRARHSYAITLFQSGKKKEAVQAFEDNIREHPSYYKNYATLANIYRKMKNLPQCIAYLELEVEHNPKQPERQTLLAKLLLKRGDIEGAIEHFREALREEVRHREALLGIGHAFAQSDDLAKSLYYFKRMRRYYPKDSASLQAIVQVCNKASEPMKALQTILEEYKSHPERIDTYVVLTKLYLTHGQLDKAQEVVNRLLLNDPENIDGFKLRAALSLKSNELETALADLRAVNKETPDPETLLAEADCLVKMKSYSEALSIIHKILGQKSGHSGALYLAGCIFASTQLAGQAYFAFALAHARGDKSLRVKKKISATQEYLLKRRRIPSNT